MAHAATATTGFGGPGVKALTTKAKETRRQSRLHKGMLGIRLMGDSGEREEIETCSLSCGYRGVHIAKHIAAKHPLHPAVQYYCSACG